MKFEIEIRTVFLAMPLAGMILVGMGLVGGATASGQSTARPGDLYREYSYFAQDNKDWRITDDRAVERFERAAAFLPNPRLPIEIADLTDAVGAEVRLDRWGGHRGTVDKRIRFNGNGWLPVPELQGVPEGLRPESLMFQDNPVVSVPLSHLVEGTNFFEGDCDEEDGFGWGQWGVYAITVRIYYRPDSKSSIEGEILSPRAGATLGENPEIVVAARAEQGVSRIDVVGYYEDYDFDGDGLFVDWQESYHQLVQGAPVSIGNHIGTRWSQPYRVRWETRWVPDQAPGSIRFEARIEDSRGYWRVTDRVEGLSLQRSGVSVKLYRAAGVPEEFGVRAGRTKECTISIPEADIRESSVVEAGLHFRSWHGWDGHHDPLQLNAHRMPIEGKNHRYDYDLLPLPAEALRGGENLFRIHSETEHHHLEVLWPGPALVVRYQLR